MRKNGFWLLAPALLLAFSVAPAHANLITDPGFESCTGGIVPPFPVPPGWTASGSSSCGRNPHTDTWDNDFVASLGTLSQSIATVAGDNYDFSFWLSGFVDSPNSFTVSFGSDEVLDLANSAEFGYTLEDFTATATGASTTISFSAKTHGGTWSLDDVSVTDLGPSAPEPASLALLATGLLGVSWRFRRQRIQKGI